MKYVIRCRIGETWYYASNDGWVNDIDKAEKYLYRSNATQRLQHLPNAEKWVSRGASVCPVVYVKGSKPGPNRPVELAQSAKA